MVKVSNPILSGFYPDPSVCRVGSDYYLVNSTFSYAPGIPIFHSKDFVNWKQIGNVLEREEQFNLIDLSMSQGIYAPTIRYNDGIFYIITTNVPTGGNFYVTAKNPEGPWSDPVFLEEAKGIDPSLFFEDDRAYYVGQRQKKNAKFFGDCELWLQELNLENGKLIGDIHILWDGAMKDAFWAEGPHLYKKDEYYYLMIAEGGTQYNHSITIARSKNIFGPYISCPYNPIFTHRHLGKNAIIQNVGHGDLVETADGDWYMLMLGTRPINGVSPLGRETFVADVIWEDGWPIINHGTGMLRDEQEINKSCVLNTKVKEDIFWQEPMDLRCLFFRFPENDTYEIHDDKISLKVLPHTFNDSLAPAYIGTRITDFRFSISTKMNFVPMDKNEAGLVYLYDENNYVSFLKGKTLSGAANEYEFKVVLIENGEKKPIITINSNNEIHEIKLELNNLILNCFLDEENIAKMDVSGLTSEIAGGFVGCTMGIYASSNGSINCTNSAVFTKLCLNN